MRKTITAMLVVLSVFAIGLNAPAVSTIVEDVIGGIIIFSNSAYAIDNATIDISVNNLNYPGYGNGLSPSSTYRFDDALTIENNVSKTGMDVVCVKIQSNDKNLKFYSENAPPSYTLNVILGKNESKSVGIEINSSLDLGLKEGGYTIYVYSGECK